MILQAFFIESRFLSLLFFVSNKYEEFPWPNILSTKKSQSQTVIREKLRKAHSYKKVARKMLIKLTPAVNFINIFRAQFFVQIFCQSQNVTRKSC